MTATATAWRLAAWTLLGAGVTGGCVSLSGLSEGSASPDDAAVQDSANEADAGGSEAASEAGVAPPLTCPPGKKACFDACVDKDRPEFGCGETDCSPCDGTNAASVRCMGDSGSGKLVCQVSCKPGFADCDGLAGTGCETSLFTAAHCGGCGQACGETTPLCAPSGDTFACVSVCAHPQQQCVPGECTNVLESVAHCSACNTPCPVEANSQATCANGVCDKTCNPLFHACQGLPGCFADSSASRCGAACVDCVAGAKGNQSAVCVNGSCSYGCLTGWADCDGLPGNGCEASLLTFPNCGSCGNDCQSQVPGADAPKCCSGVCTMAGIACP